MTRKKKPTGSQKKKAKLQQKQTVRLAVTILVCCSLLLGLLFVYFSRPQQPLLPPPEPPEKISIATYADVELLVEQELLASARSDGWRHMDSSGDLVRLQMFGDYPDSTRLMELSTRIALTDSPAQLDLSPRKGIVRVYWQGELRMELLYKISEQVKQKRPMVAIIMDDMGRNISGFRNVLSLTLPVTPAILPNSTYATRGAGILKTEGHEYMIHLPMEPKDFPAVDPGPDALLLSLDQQELKRRLQLYRQLIPGAAGGNNHMGSRFTEDRPAMRTVLEEMKAAGFYFVDSRTIGDSVAFDEARRIGMRTAQRHIFLDNEENVEYISSQLRKMVRIAEEKGAVIAICHPYPETFQALRQSESWLRAQKVDFVMASKLVRRY